MASHLCYSLCAALILGGCAAAPQPVSPTGKRPPPSADAGVFSPAQLAKTDMDRIADNHRREAFAGLRRLTEKLYRRNPREWKQAGQPSLLAAMAYIFDNRSDWRLAELDGKQGAEALHLAFLPDFRGDRVLAFAVGLGSMMDVAFEGKSEFFILDELDAQKLYNCARNIEIAAWKLNAGRDSQGEPLLLSNEAGPGGNLSFEREFGKLIGNLDLLSNIVADKANRSVVHMIQGLTTAIFLPVGR